jgi:glutamine synthetase
VGKSLLKSVAVSSDISLLRHIHVSMRSKEGKNLFSIEESEMKTGRQGAANRDTKFISSFAEHFLAGLLDGLTDSE